MDSKLTPPTIEWVVDTGRPILVARVKYNEEAIKAQVIPSMRIVGSSSKAFVLRILFRIVSATLAPTPTAPAINPIISPFFYS